MPSRKDTHPLLAARRKAQWEGGWCYQCLWFLAVTGLALLALVAAACACCFL